MKISLCVTTFNEEKSIRLLLLSLTKQSKKPDEIVTVDSKSTDSTTKIIKSFQNRLPYLKVIVKKCSRAEGRNIAVKAAEHSIIAMTDAGCVLDKNWIERITKPFKDGKVDIVAGFYKMDGSSPFQKALSCFLGVKSEDFNDNFLPSTRSIAFRRGVWKRVGGFPENLNDTAEDTVFNYKAIKNKLKIVRVKNALVYWMIPEDFVIAIRKFYSYAKGDAKSKIFWHPTKRFRSHNIKVFFVYVRYAIGLTLFLLGFSSHLLWFPLIFFFFLYIFWSFYKVYRQIYDLRAGIWGVAIQFCCDLAVMAGFIGGILS